MCMKHLYLLLSTWLIFIGVKSKHDASCVLEVLRQWMEGLCGRGLRIFGLAQIN
jgi:hypothetical protein